MSILQLPTADPCVILIDWHATLVDTHDAMYHAVDDVLPRLEELGLLEHLLAPDQSKTVEDAKLVKYVRDNQALHPRIVAERKISRTDIFEVLFGDNPDAKRRAHGAFDESYRKYVGEVTPLEPDTRVNLQALRELDITLGLISNRNREFMNHELAIVDDTGWEDLFDAMTCGNDVPHRKPHPDLLLKALEQLGRGAGEHVWYVGDSTTDVIAAKRAGVTAVFYNGAGWDQAWIDKIFPGTVRHPHRPDAVVDNLGELVDLARHMRAQHLRVERSQD
ncbi:phosphoglycolate phosphatase protein [Salinisphaera shabanensis E1L3A]|jgi:phosphoglycolate phosphatase|uniref:phosphoglycolate phosphatase n=1 Tax=Salinisphaera shabanensis E1L3A TaxID=1033802 RepID=F7Q885_9GAMM|nr:HAD-IA family hydrolase [Salinisphaera shabanensis]ERJ17752.1 phosphoglycolate phosphatase protein [Salinisphaera shabanensis E1L3A]